MNSTFDYKNKSFQIVRYPGTNNRSLQAWSAADEHLLRHVESIDLANSTIAIYNDRFGFMSVVLNDFSPITIVDYFSQKKSIKQNFERNHLAISNLEMNTALSDFSKKINFGLFKIPKSMDLFRLQLSQIHSSLEKDGIIFCGFMTKYFTPQILEISNYYFEEIEQSKAWKKSRVLILKKKNTVEKISLLHSISFEEELFQQYFGVFSAKNIDYASQFFIQNLSIKIDENKILDLASGNGFLGKMIRQQNPDCDIYLLDDSFLAIESSKLNFSLEKDKNTFFQFADSLENFENHFFDLVVSNPPFHFEHETNIEISIRLFREVKRCLNENGRFLLVANRHLNYKTHLQKIWTRVETVAENEKFIVYECNTNTLLD